MSLDNVITGVTVETAFAPPMRLDHPLVSDQTPSLWLKIVRPKITVESPFWQTPHVYMPYGDPGDLWQITDLLLVVGLAVGLGLVLRKAL